ncbi:MAG: hypothetical protein HC833_05015, partial [Leptolyngbyaceae cyanobacterium RM1_406_9]|nr:hypothetical protein [Leptolyngbyaceae cyanobacterium RM1_406_9]
PMVLSYTAKDQIENLLDLINQEGMAQHFPEKLRHQRDGEPVSDWDETAGGFV